jgi:hypothetical protein
MTVGKAGSSLKIVTSLRPSPRFSTAIDAHRSRSTFGALIPTLSFQSLNFLLTFPSNRASFRNLFNKIQ